MFENENKQFYLIIILEYTNSFFLCIHDMSVDFGLS